MIIDLDGKLPPWRPFGVKIDDHGEGDVAAMWSHIR
jgi:hypothetical protein